MAGYMPVIMATFPCTAISVLVRLGTRKEDTAFRLAPAAPLGGRGRGVTTGKERGPPSFFHQEERIKKEQGG